MGIRTARSNDRNGTRDKASLLLGPVKLCGTGDRHDPRLLSEEPRDRDLRGSRVLLFRDSAEPVDEHLIGLHCLRCEALQVADAHSWHLAEVTGLVYVRLAPIVLKKSKISPRQNSRKAAEYYESRQRADRRIRLAMSLKASAKATG